MLIFSYALTVLALAVGLAGIICLSRRTLKQALPGAWQRILRAAGGTLLLFLFVQSSIERYIGFSLFLPVSGGQPMPVRAVSLCLCAVGCFAFGATEKGRGLGERFSAACNKDWARWLTALAVTGLLFLWTSRVTVLSYMSNDDVFLVRSISRIPDQGLAAAGDCFSNILFCGLLSVFYRLDPDGLWYLGYHLFALLGSSVIIGRCILTKTSRRRISASTSCLIHSLLFAGVFLYTFAQLSFTVTPAVVGSAAVALMLCRDELKTSGGRAASDIGSVVLMLLCFLHRQSTGQAVLCFWALAVVYAGVRVLLSRDGKWKRQLTALGLSAVCLLGLWTGARSFSNSVTSGSVYDSNYWNAEYYRSLIVDFLDDELTADEYARAGVSQELAAMIHGWYFMDEQVTTDLFRELSDIYYADQAREMAALPAVQRLLAPFGTLFDRLWNDGLMQSHTALALCLLILCAAAFCRIGRRFWPEFLTALCAVGGSCILLLYLIIQGRFLIRVFLVVMIPAIVTLLLMLLSMVGEFSDAPPKKRFVFNAVFTLFCLASGFFCLRSAYLTPYAAEPLSRADVFAGQWAIEDYANSHNDMTIISSIYDYIFDPIHPQSAYPTNTVLWGACGDTAKAPEDRLYADTFFREDVLFMSDRATNAPFLLQYLSVEHGPVQARVEEQFPPSIAVYDIDRIDPGENYTGWYEQNGLTYYFENGKAVTGTRIIDGTEYKFAPAGAEAGLSVYTDSETGQAVYTTRAYSLVTGD